MKILDNDALFESVEKTAGAAARKLKVNKQHISDRPEIRRVPQQVHEDLPNHTVFRRFAKTARIGRTFVSRYQAGMAYGTHFYDAFNARVPTDISFTLFLSVPEAYFRAELEMMSAMGSQAIKLPTGCAVVYPSNQLHAVRPVEQGVRLSIVGWLESRIRSAEQRGQPV